MTILIIASCAVIFVAALFAFNKEKKVKHILREIRYELDFQLVGAGGLLDDYIQFWRDRLPEPLPDRTGDIAVVTGGARGIGLELVRNLLRCNMTVVIGVRRTEQAESLRNTLDNEENLIILSLDLTSLKSIKSFAEEVKSKYTIINLLVNNAGIMFGDFKLTGDGVEMQFGVNYLGHFYLTHLLLPELKRAGEFEHPSRVVNVSSCAHYPGEIYFADVNMKDEYITSAAYAQSKLAQIMSTRFLEKKLQEEKQHIHFYSVHPGVVNTDLFQETSFHKYFGWVMKIFFKSPAQGARSVTFACIDKALDSAGGIYISNCREGYSNKYSKIASNQAKLFDLSCEMLSLNANEYGK